jgi:conjugal transfer/entry exclusion protein
MMNQRFLAAVFALSLSIALPTHAQILGTGVMPVTEIGPNLAQNSITATQSIITAAESVLQTANMVRELVPVDEIIVGKQIAEDLATLGEVLSNAEAVWYDLKSLDAQVTALFGLEHAPDTRAGLDARLVEIKQFYYRTLSYAMRTQTLMTTLICTIEHVSRLIDSLGDLLGNMQGNQTLAQTDATISKTLAVMEIQTAAWQRTDTVDRLSEKVVMESLTKINLKRLERHPRY